MFHKVLSAHRLWAPVLGVALLTTTAVAQTQPVKEPSQEFGGEVIEHKNCAGGGEVLLVRSGPVIAVEQYAPKGDGIFAGYRTAYDANQMAKARADFEAIPCKKS